MSSSPTPPEADLPTHHLQIGSHPESGRLPWFTAQESAAATGASSRWITRSPWPAANDQDCQGLSAEERARDTIQEPLLFTGRRTSPRPVTARPPSPRAVAGWSSKAHVNRIKMLKRQMLGRAGFDLLRNRVLLAG